MLEKVDRGMKISEENPEKANLKKKKNEKEKRDVLEEKGSVGVPAVAQWVMNLPTAQWVAVEALV